MPLTLASRVVWDEAELGAPHILRVQVTHSDGERLASIEGSTEPRREEGMAPGQPVGTWLVLVLPLQFRREGDYSVSIALDTQVLKELPLVVETVLPQL